MNRRVIVFFLLLGLLLVSRATGASARVAGSFDIRAYGAVPNGKTKCTESFRKAIDAATTAGGGTIYVPAGVFLTGPIHLKSHITLYLDAGSVLKFSTNFDDYLPMVPSRWEGIEVTNFSPLIYALNAEDISIQGRGRLDGQGVAWWSFWAGVKKAGPSAPRSRWEDEFLKHNTAGVPVSGNKFLPGAFLRPPFVQPYGCTNVLIEGVTVVNSPFWTITPVYCDNVTIHGVTIHNPETGPNTDGINPDSSRNIHISDCNISVGDDCITIKSGRDADGRRVGRPTENIAISNCTMANGHGGVVIGSEMSGGVRNITIANCVFDGTERGIRIKSSRGRGGVVEDVRVSNVVMRHLRREAVVLTTFYEKSDPEPVSERTPIFRNIHFSGITGDAKSAGDLTGLTEMPLEGVSFTDVRLETSTGMFILDARDVSFRNVVISTEKGPSLVADRTIGLDIDGFRTGKLHTSGPVIDLRDVRRVFIHGCAAPVNAAAFVRVTESSSTQVALEGNHFELPKSPAVITSETK